ncbi:PEP/pyruvate-binding domain-containing protein [Desulfomarina sp.]
MTQHYSASPAASRFKLFHELMRHKVRHILLISTPYEAWIMEQDCRLSEQIVHEYSGLNLSHPPRLTWVSSTEEALTACGEGKFDFVIIIAQAVNDKIINIGRAIKEKHDMVVVVLTHQETPLKSHMLADGSQSAIDRIFFWTGQADILLAIIKCIEDQFNVLDDISCADVRVILFVEDSPFYLSALLPVLYKELVKETQAVIEDSLNQEHRLLTMRARPKILLAHTFEQAMALYEQFEPNILGVISDVRYPRKNKHDGEAGLRLLKHIKKERFDIPLLLTSSEPHNADRAASIPAPFIDKNAPFLNRQIRSFLLNHLGFGEFTFRDPQGNILARADSLHSLEQKMLEIPIESFIYHSQRNDFSRFLYTLTEVELAGKVRPMRHTSYETVEMLRQELVQMIKEQRMQRQRGVIVDFDKKRFDPDTEFTKIGNGSLGGKARGLAFFSAMLHQHWDLMADFSNVEISVPQTLVLTSDGFDAFIELNDLGDLAKEEISDEAITEQFLQARFPEPFRSDIQAFLKVTGYPLAVRSSSMLEDAQFKSYAGLYHTYILANDHPDDQCRLNQMLTAIKKVYASTYFRAPKAFSKRVGNRVESEKMAIIIQRAVGRQYDNYFYPALSGVVQSLNYYPFSCMKTEDGIASIALGLGKAVMEGENTLRFSPKHPEILPQRSTVEDILKGSQKKFYAITMNDPDPQKEINDTNTLSRVAVHSVTDHYPVRFFSSTYSPSEHRIRDFYTKNGHQVITFASLLKYNTIPFTGILNTLLTLGREKLGCAVEIEFALNLSTKTEEKNQFHVLQIRPMSAREETLKVKITEEEISSAFCVSNRGLGNTVNREMCDIIYVRPENFDPAKTTRIAREIGEINNELTRLNRKYLLIGPGRWGSSDHWLGIPVTWEDICGVGSIVETVHSRINAEPSQGSHFFHNLTTLGINYLNVDPTRGEKLDYSWLAASRPCSESEYISHIQTEKMFTLKVDGRTGLAVIFV